MSEAAASGFDKASVRDADVGGKRVLLRADLNVPLEEGAVADDTRLRAALPTIELLRDRGARVVLVSHLGRPKGPDPEFSMRAVGDRLEDLLGAPVGRADAVIGDEVAAASEQLDDGQVLLLENVRFEPGETTNDPELAAALAELADLFVNDAFGTAHRAHASTAGVAGHLPAHAGLLLERELRELGGLLDDPDRPFVVVIGGAKVSDKLGVIKRFLDIADAVLVGGAMAFTFFRAQGIATGDSLVEEDGIELAKDLLDRAGRSDCELSLPVDLVLGREFSADTERRELDGVEVPDGWMGLDVGAKTATAYAQRIMEAGTTFWNGPMGAFEMEPFAAGTRTVAEAIAATPGASVVGGGDSAAALVEFGLGEQVTWLSTGGGASLELLEGEPLPGVEALLDA